MNHADEARVRAVQHLIAELTEFRDVALAQSAIKRDREGTVDPAWEGPTADDCATEAEVYQYLIDRLSGEDATPSFSDRGFAHFNPVPSEYGGDVRVSESSAASGPHLWLRIVSPVDLNDRYGPQQESVAHLTLENATTLRDQLTYLINHHYQIGGPR